MEEFMTRLEESLIRSSKALNDTNELIENRCRHYYNMIGKEVDDLEEKVDDQIEKLNERLEKLEQATYQSTKRPNMVKEIQQKTEA
jgi:cell division protein FtsB